MTDSPSYRGTRLAQERLEADRRYNEALTRLDRALAAATRVPDAPPPYNWSLLDDINANARWDILRSGVPVPAGGWRGRLSTFVWRLVGPAFQQQRALNAALVNHLNRNAAGHGETHRALAELVVAFGAQVEARASFDSLLLQYLQQITGFVESKDRELAAAIAEVRAVAELSQRSSVMAKREVERLAAGSSGGARAGASAPPAAPGAGASDAFKYVGFEDLFRGSEDEIRARMREYVPVFAGATNVLDVGCGRGEFLSLLKEAGVAACGLDLNHEMVEACRASGLEAGKAMRSPTWTDCPTKASEGSWRHRWSSTSSPATSRGSSRPRTTSCGPARRSCSRQSTPRAGWRSSRATSATSRTCGRSTPTR